METEKESKNIEIPPVFMLESLLVNNCPFAHPDLKTVVLGGSKGSNSAGRMSDIDITTVLEPEHPMKVDFDAIVTLSQQLRQLSFNFALREKVAPLVIATIRLEEAQTTMAEMSNPGKTVLPIHWLHYPSVEFALANELPSLFFGLLRGKAIHGNPEEVIAKFEETKPIDCQALLGLDWLTDSLRVFLANRNGGDFPISLQPDSFIKRLATHNLEYFWKWKIIAKLLKEMTGIAIENWKDAQNLSSEIPNELWSLASQVRTLRHQGTWARDSEIIDLHRETFSLWPI